ncbi:alpha/beta-hydrolase [Cristinia sonorae]|uniref:Alpha/beta-hydrolase n=1 Tax=Cristinia sonorae TaxID=1940300 RepID=A0A8K0XR93_9AGAR|nr:alpha/beta-hydrolase [Cristinia sonorae]
MPFIDLVAKDDYASLWYITNTPCGNVGGFDPAKPTIVMMHPLHVDSTWLYPQFDDPRLTGKYNIIAFDTRLTGTSMNRFTGKYDFYVAAADLAHAFYHLRLPPAHIWASEAFCYVALRLAAIFPELCLSVTLCNVPAQTEPKAVFEGLEELTRLWCYAEDLESFEYACSLHLSHNASPDIHPEVADEMVTFFQMNWPPFKRSKLITFGQFILNRIPMNTEELAAVRCPVLICQAEANPVYPMVFAEKLVEDLINVPGEVILYKVKASIGLITIFSASIVNKVFHNFLSRLPSSSSELEESTKSVEEVMQESLHRLATLRNDPSVARRDPKSPLAFSMVTQEVWKSQEDAFKVFAKGERKAFSPLTENGRPIRKYSERKDDWIQINSDGYSYSNTPLKSKLSKEKPKKTKSQDFTQPPPPPPPPPLPPAATVRLEKVEIPISEPVSSTEQALARSRRLVVGPSYTVEQQVVKGSKNAVAKFADPRRYIS